MRLNLNKRYEELSEAEKVAFYHNVKRTTFRYICKFDVYSELAYEVIDDSYMKAIRIAKKDVNLRSLRSYIGTISWREFNRRKKARDTNTQYYERVEQKFDLIDDPFEESVPMRESLKYAIRRLTSLEKRRLRDMVKTEVDYDKLESIWGLSYNSCRQVVFKIRKKLQKDMDIYNKKGEAI